MATASRSIAIFHSPFFNNHHPPSHQTIHPETPRRTDVCINALKTHAELTPHLSWKEVQPSSNTQTVLYYVKQVHTEAYLNHLQTLSSQSKNLCEDTYTTSHTYDVALLAAGTWMDCVDHAISNHAAFALTRPPGHHALPSFNDQTSSSGFCLLNNASIAARYSLSKPGISNVSIIDFDVHHGNGIEEAVKNLSNVRCVSIHQPDLYPKTGTDNLGGQFKNVLNVSLPPGSGFDTLLPRLENEIVPFMYENNPDMVIISAGFDALEKDTLGGLKFQPEDYRELVKKIAKKDTKFVFGLEGGYYVGEGGLGEAICECITGYCFQ